MTVPSTVRLQREPFDAAAEAAQAHARAHRCRRAGHLHRHLPRRRGGRADRRAHARALSRHGGGRDRAPRRRRRKQRWPLLGVTVIHRYGRIVPGEDIVLVVTASSHRAGGVRGGRIPDGLSEDPRAVLETGREGGRENLGGSQGDRRRGGRALGCAARARSGGMTKRESEGQAWFRSLSRRWRCLRSVSSRRRPRTSPITTCRAARIRMTWRRRRTARSGTPRRARARSASSIRRPAR